MARLTKKNRQKILEENEYWWYRLKIGGYAMTKFDAEIFIEKMEEIGDIWTVDQVLDVYGDDTLENSLEKRKSEVGIFMNIISSVIQKWNNEKGLSLFYMFSIR